MGTRVSPQYVNIFTHRFEHDFFAAQNLQPTLYTSYIDDIFFLWTHVKNRNDPLRRQTRDKSDRVSFVVQYFPGAEKLHHVLRSLQHFINDDEHLAKIFPTPPLLTFKQLPNLTQTIVCSKQPSLQDNIDHNSIQPCHDNLCKTCQIFDMDTDITHEKPSTTCMAYTH
eukprot:g23490.t1